jgi:hypothetical protein
MTSDIVGIPDGDDPGRVHLMAKSNASTAITTQPIEAMGPPAVSVTLGDGRARSTHVASGTPSSGRPGLLPRQVLAMFMRWTAAC